MHQLLIFISLMICAKTTSFQRYSSLDIAIPSNVLKIEPIRNNQYAFWYANNIISIRGPFPTLAQQFNISLADYLGGISFNPTQIKTDIDGNVMVGAYLQSICWVNFLTNQTGCNYNATLSLTYIINDFQFIDKFMNLIIGTDGNNYVIANLLSGNINSYNISFIFLSFTNFRNKIYGVTNTSFIYVMELNSSNINYRIFISYLNISLYDIPSQKKIFKGFYLNGIQFLGMLRPVTFYVFKISTGYFANFALGGNYIGADFQPIDGTIILSSSGVINQYQIYPAPTILTWQTSLTSLFIVSKQIFISSSQIYFLLYPKNSPNSSFIQVYKINQGISSCSTLSNVSNCQYCNLPSGSSCSFCQYGYYLNISTCSITGCQLYQKFNSGVCQQVCGITQVYDEQTNRCICPNSFAFNQYLNICQSLCDDVNCVSCYISSYCYQCNAGYSLNQTGQCMVINNSTLPTPTNTTNTTNTNATNTTNTTNATGTTSTLNGSCQAYNCIQCQSTNLSKCILCSDETTFYLNSNGQCLQKLSQPSIGFIIKNITVYPLSIPSFKTLAKSSLYLFFFLDDYWYYVYHAPEYKQEVAFVFQMIKQANQQTLVPQFIDFSQVKRKIQPKLFMTSHYEYYTPQKIKEIDQQSIQFLQRTHQMYVYDYGGSIFLFLIMKIIVKIVQKFYVQRQKGILNSIYLYIVEFSNLKTLFVSLFESCAVYISFNCSLQLLTPSYFMIMDKFSLVIGHFFFFIIIIYSLCFYFFIYGVQSRKEAQIYLNFSIYSVGGFANEAVLNPIRTLCNGFVHGFFINKYQIQLLLLILIKLLLITSILIFRKKFQNKFTFVMFLFYFIIGGLLDLIFVFDYILKDISTSYIGFVQAMILGLLLFITCLMFFGASIIAIGTFFKEHCLKNKVQPIQKIQMKKEKLDNPTQRKRQFDSAFKKTTKSIKFTEFQQIQFNQSQNSSLSSSKKNSNHQQSSSISEQKSQNSNISYKNKFNPYSNKTFSLFKIQQPVNINSEKVNKLQRKKTNFQKKQTNFYQNSSNENNQTQKQNVSWNNFQANKIQFKEKNFLPVQNKQIKRNQIKSLLQLKSNYQIKNNKLTEKQIERHRTNTKIKEDPQIKRRKNNNTLNITFGKGETFDEQF